MLPVIVTPGTTRENWPLRRQALLELFQTYEFGRRPELPFQVDAELTGVSPALDGAARREMYQVTVRTCRGAVSLEMALVLPRSASPVPTVLLLSNHDRVPAPAVPPDVQALETLMRNAPGDWAEQTKKLFAGMAGSPGPEALDISQDDHTGYWAVDEIVASGRAAAAFYASQAQADDRTCFPSGLTALFSDPAAPRPDDGWGALGVWAFAARCMVDVLERHPLVDASKISLAGHSRGGKAALWCAAQDDRIRAVLVNNSGCSGAALSRGKKGEVVASITAMFPHWFCPNYRRFGWREEEMPFDQHMLIAAVAPRLCCVTSGSLDQWSDPDAEWQGALAAGEAWKLFGLPALAGPRPGPGETAYSGPIGYHTRRGGHDLTAWDWKNFMRFLDLQGG